MIIGVDVDGTVADLHRPWLDWYNNKIVEEGCFDGYVGLEDITAWNIEQFVIPKWKKRIFKFIERKKSYNKVFPIDGALEGVNALRELGHRVVFITSANKYVAGRKLDWLADHGFLVPKYGKISADYIECHDKGLINVNVLVDDGVHNIEAFIDKIGGEGILFDQPWNKKGCPYARRATSWDSVVRIVNQWTRCPVAA